MLENHWELVSDTENMLNDGVVLVYTGKKLTEAQQSCCEQES